MLGAFFIFKLWRSRSLDPSSLLYTILRNPKGVTLPRILRWRLLERVGCILCDTVVDQD